jgi:hypothetical protein
MTLVILKLTILVFVRKGIPPLSIILHANLLVRFLLELCALASLGYWGFQTGTGPLAKFGGSGRCAEHGNLQKQVPDSVYGDRRPGRHERAPNQSRN